MKAVILAGGLGTRLSEETGLRPKPMVEVGGRPILWHIMKLYSFHGINEFIICCGYKGFMIKEYFANYFLHMSDITIDLNMNSMNFHSKRAEPWKITLVDTGENSMTGGRLLRIKEYLEGTKDFCFTYGDGVGNIDISACIKFHNNHGKLATMTATNPPGRFGEVLIEKNIVKEFREKPSGDTNLINAGFFVLNTKVFDYLENDQTIWEHEPLRTLAMQNQLVAYEHKGFWQPMDTLRDKIFLEKMWNRSQAPWKVW
ncbi:glucose-1-phosphate cytidylyltransferase [Amylibacter sp.]|nr:glucose-1-phosphate cytidylyltransferase [Amylibacter sp.]